MSDKQKPTMLGTIFTTKITDTDLIDANQILQNKETTPIIANFAHYAKVNSDRFSFIVNLMRRYNAVPLPAINELMRLCWCVMGSNHVMFMCGIDIPSLGTSCKKVPQLDKHVVACPVTWFLMAKQDPFGQAGAIVNTASKVRDIWNDKVEDTIGGMQRAAAYEAEYFLWITTKERPTYKLNEYQQDILTSYPKGLASLQPELVYTSKPPPQHPLDG